ARKGRNQRVLAVQRGRDVEERTREDRRACRVLRESSGIAPQTEEPAAGGHIVIRVKPDAGGDAAATLQLVTAQLIAKQNVSRGKAQYARLTDGCARSAGRYQWRQRRSLGPPHQKLHAAPHIVIMAASAAAAASAVGAAGVFGVVRGGLTG